MLTPGAYVLLLVAPALGVAGFMLTQLLYNWLRKGNRVLPGFLLGLLAGWMVQLVVTIGVLSRSGMGWNDAAGLGLVNQFIFLALADGYIHFVNIMICSLRLRVLHELLVTPAGLTEEEILSRYNARQLVEMRLERLRGSGRVHFENGRYYTRFTLLLLLGRLYRWLKILLLGKRPSRMHEAVKQ